MSFSTLSAKGVMSFVGWIRAGKRHHTKRLNSETEILHEQYLMNISRCDWKDGNHRYEVIFPNAWDDRKKLRPFWLYISILFDPMFLTCFRGCTLDRSILSFNVVVIRALNWYTIFTPTLRATTTTNSGHFQSQLETTLDNRKFDFNDEGMGMSKRADHRAFQDQWNDDSRAAGENVKDV